MSNFFSTKYLRYRGLDSMAGRIIDRDQPCTDCSYNLRGLMNTGKCPECGTPIKVPTPARTTLLSDAPLEDIRKLAFGLWLGVACVPAVPVATFFGAGLAIWGAGAVSWRDVGVILVLVSLLWATAVWCMTPVLQTAEGVKFGFTAESRTRQIARWSQFGWAAALLIALSAPGAPFAGMAIVIAVLVGVSGLVALSLILGRLADWACDESAASKLNLTVWLLPLATAMLLVMAVLPVVLFLSCTAIVMWLTALFAFGIALVSLASSASWSWKHATTRMAREAVQRARTVHRPPPPPPSDEPIRLAEPGDPMPAVGLADFESGQAAEGHTLDDIVRDVSCTTCGYNLRGLKVYSRCPECGERIASA